MFGRIICLWQTHSTVSIWRDVIFVQTALGQQLHAALTDMFLLIEFKLQLLPLLLKLNYRLYLFNLTYEGQQ